MTHFIFVSSETCALQGYYTALSGSSVLTFRDSLLIPSSRVLDFLMLEDETNMLF
jgi:hypothetical protein